MPWFILVMAASHWVYSKDRLSGAAQLTAVLLFFKSFIFKKFYHGTRKLHMREERVRNPVYLLPGFRICSPELVSSPSYIFIIFFSSSPLCLPLLPSNFSHFSSSTFSFFF